MSKAIVGIDLGTTNSAIAYIDDYGSPTIIPNDSGDLITPSAIYFQPDGETSVGKEAKEALAYDSKRVASLFKRNMGDPNYSFYVGDSTYSAKDLSAILLKSLAEQAKKALGVEQLSAIITVPAYFHNGQREETMQAGKAAGLDVICTINEPTAAAFAYGQTHPELNGNIIVYDLGGGTFDVTLLSYSKDEIKVLASDGDHNLGGTDWDAALLNGLADKFEEAHGIDILSDDDAHMDLRLRCEEAKHSLSAREQVKIAVPAGGLRENIEISRSDLDQWSSQLLDQTRVLLVRMLKQSNLRWPDISAVLFVGGSTRMPQVAQLITSLSGKPILKDINPDECVANGAALQATWLTKNQSLGAITSAKVSGLALRAMTDVSPHSLGYIQESTDGTRFINGIVIKKNTPLPTKQVKPSQVWSDSLEIIVLQGEAERVLDNEVVGSYLVKDIPHINKDTVVDVSFGYNISGIIEVTAIERSTNKNLTVEKAPFPDDLSWTDGSPEDQACNQPCKIMLAIDTSSSMSGNKLEEAKKAALEFLNQIDIEKISIGIAEFGASQGIVCNPVNDKTVIQSKINSLSASGGTPMAGALNACNSVFKRDEKGIIVLLSDGYPDNPGSAITEADDLKQKDVIIYTVGVEGADKNFLNSIASDPDRNFDVDLGDLVSTFRKIGRQVSASPNLVKL